VTGFGKEAKSIAKTLKVNRSKSPQSAKHLEDTGQVNKPLTIDRAGSAQRRNENMKGVGIKPGMDRDESPPAVFKENGGNASVRHIPSGDNRSAGAQIGNQLKGVKDGECVKIEICK